MRRIFCPGKAAPAILICRLRSGNPRRFSSSAPFWVIGKIANATQRRCPGWCQPAGSPPAEGPPTMSMWRPHMDEPVGGILQARPSARRSAPGLIGVWRSGSKPMRSAAGPCRRFTGGPITSTKNLPAPGPACSTRDTASGDVMEERVILGCHQIAAGDLPPNSGTTLLVAAQDAAEPHRHELRDRCAGHHLHHHLTQALEAP